MFTRALSWLSSLVWPQPEPLLPPGTFASRCLGCGKVIFVPRRFGSFVVTCRSCGHANAVAVVNAHPPTDPTVLQDARAIVDAAKFE